MSRESAKQLYARLEDYIQQYAGDHYGGNPDEGFRHWAFREVFLEDDFSDTEIVEKTRIDGTDDFDIDGFHVEDAEEQKTIHLFQCKHLKPGTSVGDDELQKFLGAPERVVHRELIAECRNEETKALHDELVRLVPEGYGLNMVFVTSGTFSPQARTYAETRSSTTCDLMIGGRKYTCQLALAAYDLRSLVDLFTSHLEGVEAAEPRVELIVDPNRCHEIGGDYRTVEMTVPVGEIIAVFEQHRYKIFRLNPRGPLANKTNRDIRATLNDPVRSRIFHLLNNGLSVICDSYTYSGNRVRVHDFQVVNGCQTTVTLWDARHRVRDDPNVLVNVKLIECPSPMHQTIATATNTQARLKAEDFVSRDPVQIELQVQFRALRPSWFYEIKRGEWSRIYRRSEDRKPYRERDGTHRWFKNKDGAQAVVAYLGFPGEAKDKIRFFFSDKLSSVFGDLSYRDVYGEGLRAVQVPWPTVLHRRIGKAVVGDLADLDLKTTGVAEWLEYGRFHILWIMGELIRSPGGRPEGTRRLHTPEESRALLSTADQWFDGLYRVARQALTASIREVRGRQSYKGPREFFRSSGNYQLILDNVPAALDFAKGAGVGDPRDHLPK